jgi:citrate lyase subunit beta / citryl-CoA lyase
MTESFRPRRSVLYMPASNARALEKATTIPCDTLIFDLEDAVAPGAKVPAREQAVAAVASGAYGRREIVVRCNGLATPWGPDDLAAVAATGAAGVLVPKVDDGADVVRVQTALDTAGASDETKIWAMIETPRSIFEARHIASFERVEVLVMGTNDLAKELRVPLKPGRRSLESHLATVVLAARAEGKAVIDGVFNDLQDTAGFEEECRQGLELGFDGKTLIHPSQVGPCNDVWSPDADDVAYAREVVDAYADASAHGRGVITVRGRMIEQLHVDQAARALAIDAATRNA